GLIGGRLTSLEPDRLLAHVATEDEELAIRYERLVVALGAVARALPIPGLKEHALGFKDLASAIHLRNHVLRRLEAAATAATEELRRPGLPCVFAGAASAGVEAPAELPALVRDALRYSPERRREQQRWILADAAPKILPEIPTRLGEYAAKQLTKRGIDIRVE